MRLINAHTLELEEFWDETVKEYATLSHRLEVGEVSFQDMQSKEVRSKKRGFAKIRKTCEQAVKDNLDYVWVDTCCINKDSSAELSEVINSMYRWYEASFVCYAFLSDVHKGDKMEQEMMSSLWFTRGWTLQELLAPHRLVFYDEHWQSLGTKGTLSETVTSRTGIDKDILSRGYPLSNCSIACRMSWASQRITTRVEDIAYCLLGIFDVNMPLLYGEGAKAFLRLQEEIIKQEADQTIFAWPIHREDQPGLLADSPVAFANRGHVRVRPSRKSCLSYSMTNRGLSIKLRAFPFTTDTYLVCLDCTDAPLPMDCDRNECPPRLGIFLQKLHADDQYARVEHEGASFMRLQASTRDEDIFTFLDTMQPFDHMTFNVPQRFDPSLTNYYKDRVNGFRIATQQILERSSSGEDRFEVIAHSWDPEDSIMSIKPGNTEAAVLDISEQNRRIKVVKFGFDYHYNPICFVATSSGMRELVIEVRKHRDKLLSEIAQVPGTYQRNPFGMMGWSEVHNKTAMELKEHPGLWAVKGDRVDGIDVRLVEEQSPVYGETTKVDIGTLQIVRDEFWDKMAWDVYLSIAEASTSREIFRRE